MVVLIEGSDDSTKPTELRYVSEESVEMSEDLQITVEHKAMLEDQPVSVKLNRYV